MKKIKKFGLFITALISLLLTACNKIDTPVVNKPPIANAGKDSIITLPINSIILDGSASTDPENNIKSYLWKFVYGPTSATITTPASTRTKVENLVKGIYLFELTVTDNGGRTSVDAVQITVWDPQHFNIKSVSDTIIQLPFNRAFLRTADGNIYNSTISWKKISGPNSYSIKDPSATWTLVGDLAEGVYKFELSATYWNQLTDRDTMTVTVLADNNSYTSEKIFENISWNNTLETSYTSINNFSSIVPANHPFLVYFKLDATYDWENVIPGQLNTLSIYQYTYGLGNDILEIDTYANPTSNSIIKIVY